VASAITNRLVLAQKIGVAVSIKCRAHCGAKFSRGCLASLVWGEGFGIFVNLMHGRDQTLALVLETQVIKHHGGREQCCGWINDVLPLNIGCCAVSGFKIGVIAPKTTRGCQPQTADNRAQNNPRVPAPNRRSGRLTRRIKYPHKDWV